MWPNETFNKLGWCIIATAGHSPAQVSWRRPEFPMILMLSPRESARVALQGAKNQQPDGVGVTRFEGAMCASNGLRLFMVFFSREVYVGIFALARLSWFPSRDGSRIRK